MRKKSDHQRLGSRFVSESKPTAEIFSLSPFALTRAAWPGREASVRAIRYYFSAPCFLPKPRIYTDNNCHVQTSKSSVNSSHGNFSRSPSRTYPTVAQIPAWAKGRPLHEALERQYAGGGQVDPDKIFPEVFTCDLEAIFPVSVLPFPRTLAVSPFLPSLRAAPDYGCARFRVRLACLLSCFLRCCVPPAALRCVRVLKDRVQVVCCDLLLFHFWIIGAFEVK